MRQSSISSIINGGGGYDNEHYTKHTIIWEFPFGSCKFIFLNKMTRMITRMWHQALSKYFNVKLHTIYYLLWAIITSFQNQKIQPKTTWQLSIQSQNSFTNTKPKLICWHKAGTHFKYKAKTNLPTQS